MVRIDFPELTVKLKSEEGRISQVQKRKEAGYPQQTGHVKAQSPETTWHPRELHILQRAGAQNSRAMGDYSSEPALEQKRTVCHLRLLP